MKFEVVIDGEAKVFDLYHDALNYVDQRMAQWNNFASENPLIIAIRKIKDETALHISVDDAFEVGDIFGG